MDSLTTANLLDKTIFGLMVFLNTFSLAGAIWAAWLEKDTLVKTVIQALFLRKPSYGLLYYFIGAFVAVGLYFVGMHGVFYGFVVTAIAQSLRRFIIAIHQLD